MSRTSKLIFILMSVLEGFAQAKNCETIKKIPSMGSFLEIQIVSPCHKLPEAKAFLQVQEILNVMEQEMSLYQKDSPINRLNSMGHLGAGYSHLRHVLKLSLEVSQKTKGAFDPSVLPVLQLIQKSFKDSHQPPKDSELENLRPLVDHHLILLSEQEIKFKKQKMMITLDGIAKGYAVDEVADFWEAQGFHNYLVNFSGNMRWKGQNLKGRLWKIQVWDPERKRGLNLPLPKAGAIASSSAEHVHYSENQAWHHIIDPRTLKPAMKWQSATAIGPRAALCDAFSTTFFVLGEQDIRELIKTSYPKYSAVLIKEKRIIKIF